MAPFFDEARIDERGGPRRPRLPPDAAGAGDGGRAGARGGRPVRRGAGSTGWPGVSGPGRCSWPRSAARPSSATSSSCWPSPAPRCRSACGATCRCPGWVGPARPGHRGLAVRAGPGPARARRRGGPPRRLAAHGRRRRLAARRRRGRRPGACTSASAAAGPSSRTVAVVPAHPGAAGGRTPGHASTSATAVLAETADRLDEVADACRPSLGVLRQPGQGAGRRPGRGRCPSSSATAPLNGVAAARAAVDAGPHRPRARVSGELPDDAAQVVACFDGPFTAGGGRGVGERESAPDIFADPFLDGPAAPRLGLLMLRDAPTRPHAESADRRRSPTR